MPPESTLTPAYIPPHLISITVRSHLVFTAEGEPQTDSEVLEMSSRFGQDVFGKILKDRTRATSIRLVAHAGRRTESGWVEVTLLVFYYSAQLAAQWHQFYLQFRPVVEDWADDAWRIQLKDRLVRSENSVLIEPFATHSLVNEPGRRQRERILTHASPGVHVATLLISGIFALLVVGGSAYLLLARENPDTARLDTIDQRLAALEARPTITEPAQISQTVTVGYPPPAVVETRQEQRRVRRYSSRPTP